MANLSKTRTVFGFTSPRTIEKIIPEIDILVSSFGGREWNPALQGEFFEELFKSEFYEGSKKPDDIELAARDRITRAPKALGFVCLKPKIALTEPGRQLLRGRRTHAVIARQLFKFQLPSPYHKIPADRKFNVRPYLELLRLVKTLGKLSKTEIAIFFVQITNFKKFDAVVADIKKFRAAIEKNKGNRKAFIDAIFTKEIKKIYKAEIKSKKLKTRQSADQSFEKFLATKKSNHVDYADAFIRYLRATQLISFDKKTFRLIIAPSRTEEVNYLLKAIPRKALAFKTEGDYKKYLFDPTSLTLLYDDRDYLEKRLNALKVKFSKTDTIETLQEKLEGKEEAMIVHAIEETEQSLKGYKMFDDIVSMFGKVQKREVPDPPLYFEWNIWRALVMMNYTKDIKGNFTIDLDGVPLTTAGANKPDIEVEYKGFRLIVEVTMSGGSKQYEMEGEPVARHFSRAQSSSDVPVYCLFVAPKINENTLAHFYITNKNNMRVYGGRTRIVPMHLPQFIDFMSVAKDKGFKNAKTLGDYFEDIISKIDTSNDEAEWSQNIDDSINTWVV